MELVQKISFLIFSLCWMSGVAGGVSLFPIGVLNNLWETRIPCPTRHPSHFRGKIGIITRVFSCQLSGRKTGEELEQL